MQNAPPVVYPVGRFAWGLRLACVLAFLTAGVLVLCLWWASATLCAWLAAVWGLAAIGALQAGRREWVQQGELAWDGERWHGLGFCGHDAPIQLSLTLDVGRCMLVSWPARSDEPGWPRTQHAWLCAVDMPSRWHGFRCAVYSRRAAGGQAT